MKRTLLVFAVLLLLLPAAVFAAAQADQEQAAVAGAATREAPMLAARVASGELPPLEERLPVEPLVVEPFAELGTYGGTLRKVMRGASFWAFGKFASIETLVDWTFDYAGFQPNVAKDWEISADGKQFTLRLREGMKWSDGAPFTVDDILYVWELWRDPNHPWSPNGGFTLDMEVNKIDDYTLRYDFPEPNPRILEDLAFTFTFYLPSHYLKQFTEFDRFNQMRNWTLNPELPTIGAWQLVSYEDGVVARAERNPYYWKVDTEGNQLPYLDKVDFSIVANPELLNLKIVNGEVDLEYRHLGIANYTLLKENESRANYRTLEWSVIAGAENFMWLNLDTPNSQLRELMRQRDFRVALSIGLNRAEFSRLLHLGFGEPWSIGMHPASPYYDEETGRLNTEYDPERAQRVFSDLGLKDLDGDGVLEYPDGADVTIVIDVPDRQNMLPAAELTAEQWKDLGLNAVLNSANLAERRNNGEYDVYLVYLGEGMTSTIDNRRWTPIPRVNLSYPQVSKWHLTDGEEGDVPTAWQRRLAELWDLSSVEADQAKRREYIMEIVRINAEQVTKIGTVHLIPKPVIVSNRLGNVPEQRNAYAAHGIYWVNPEQLYFKS
jgi:peptide/nickel transport system substrate-binding protein